jgi:crotonobetainyl-CoA:carnitine CoA-transferase CaiB-like acyl-CoA transferase
LDGLRILDLTRLLPGGLATQLLADLGAEVVKVEEPVVGDYMRHAPPTMEGVSHSFMLVNQGKKSIAINLKEPEGRDILYKIIPSADVLVEQFRPGVARRLGVGYEKVRELREDIVYCSFSGYGASGPYRDRPGHDLNFDALSGLLHMSSVRGRPVLPPVPMADMASGMLAAYAILAALLWRRETGRGCYIDLSIFDAAVNLNLMNLAEAFAGGEPQPGRTFLTGRFPFYDIYETADGRYLTLSAIEEKFWLRICDLLDRPDLKDKHLAVGEEGEEVRRALREAFSKRTLREWEALLGREDVPYAPVLTVAEALKDPHLRHRSLVQEVRLDGKSYRALSHPVKWSPQGPARKGRPPELGEHTVEILGDVGVDEGRLLELARQGIVGTPGWQHS